MAAVPATTSRATIRTYRHGLGDCHLVTLRGKDDATFRILIDCGIILGTPDGTNKMQAVMADVLQESSGKVDLLLATHEHWDHVSGFLQASDLFARLAVEKVWMAWTENDADPLTKQLKPQRDAALDALRAAAVRMHVDGGAQDSTLNSMLEFFGTVGRQTTKDALEAVRNKPGATTSYHQPMESPTVLDAFGARIFVLGPPKDIAQLKRILPSRSPGQTETYSLAEDAFDVSVGSSMDDTDDMLPFAVTHRIPYPEAQNLAFFHRSYWAGPPWRRIDIDWMDDANRFALALDSLTNNTSLVIAIELAGVGVLLFAADAQVGNWESWGACTWQVDGRTVTGNDLLAGTIYYKVGHHGSYNATLQDQGVKLMKQLKYAVIPVDHEMAVKKGWGNIPLASLATALEQATHPDGYVIRTDEAAPQNLATHGLSDNPLYYEVELSGPPA